MPKLEKHVSGRKVWVYFDTQKQLEDYVGSGKRPEITNVDALMDAKAERKAERAINKQCLQAYQRRADRGLDSHGFSASEINRIYKD